MYFLKYLLSLIKVVSELRLCPRVPKTVSCGNVIDILLLGQRKETHGNMLRKIGLAYLLNQPQISLKKNMLCDVQITWHGRAKQRAAFALAETHIAQSEQCDSITMEHQEIML